MLITVVLVGLLIPTLIGAVLWMVVGRDGLDALYFLLMAPLFGIGYGYVGRRIRRIAANLPEGRGTPIPAMLVRGKIEAAGLLVIDDDRLYCYPVAGRSYEIPLQEIDSFSEAKTFNGSRLWGKTGFWFEGPFEMRLGCAVPNSWAVLLRSHLP